MQLNCVRLLRRAKDAIHFLVAERLTTIGRAIITQSDLPGARGVTSVALFKTQQQNRPRLRTDAPIDFQTFGALKISHGFLGQLAKIPVNFGFVETAITQQKLKSFDVAFFLGAIENRPI
jgi:hypothetical protein